MGYKSKVFFRALSSDSMSSRQLEKAVVRRFNHKIEMFPPGVGPRDLIKDGIKKLVIKKDAGDRYRIAVK